MPVPVEHRSEFITTYLVDEFNRPLKVHPWMKEHVIEPLDGYQSWRAGEKLCVTCRLKVAQVHATLQECNVAPHDGCDGVDGTKVILTILNLKRQQGKTTTGAAYSLSELFLARNSNILYLAASEKQSGRIFESKWVQPIRRNKRLDNKVDINGTEIIHKKRGNRILYVSTSVKSVPGGSWRLLIIDEGAMIAGKVVSKLVPSIMAAQGVECPWGHYTAGIEDERTTCPACDAPLERWYGRILIMSSSDEDSGWFYELVSLIDVEPKASTHMYRSAETINPHTSESTINALEETFGRLPSMEGLMGRELRNEFTREGDEFVPAKALEAVTIKSLRQSETSEMPCVGFLDCSRTNELTSLIIVGDPGTDPTRPFDLLRLLRVDVWDPRETGGRIDYKAIRPHLSHVMGGPYPSLLKLLIDTTLIQDAKELYDWTQQQPWRGRVEAFQADRLSNQLMWQHLSQRILAGPTALQLFPHKRLHDELRAARVKVTNEGAEKVIDTVDGDHRRGRLHRDVSMSLAGCCMIAARYMARAADKSVSVAHQINNSVSLGGKFKPVTVPMAKTRF